MPKNNLIFWTILACLFALATGFLVTKLHDLSILAIIAIIAIFVIFAKILKNPFWGLLGLVFFLPFDRIPSIDLGFMNLKINQIFGGMVLLGWFLNILYSRRKLQHNILVWPIVIFLAIALISIFFSGYIPRSVLVFIFIAFTLSLVFPVADLIDSREKLEKIIQIIFLSAGVVGIFAIWQFLGDLAGLPIALTGLKEGYTKLVFAFPRVQAFSNEPLYLAAFLFLPIGLLTSYMIDRINLLKKIQMIGLLVILILVFILTVARGAYIGAAVMILYFIIFRFKRIITPANLITGLLIILIVAGGFYYFISKAEPQALDQFISRVKLEDISTSESGAGRLQTYQKAIDYWQESPIIGIGVGNYAMHSKNYPSPDDITDWDIVNNEYLEILCEMGILGMISFIIILIILFWREKVAYYATHDKFLRATLLGLTAAFLGILVQYNFFSTLYIVHIWVLVGIIVATTNLCFKYRGEK